MSSLLLQISHIFKAYGNNLLFEDISLSIHEGEIFALIGENGAGKTTLLQTFLGSILPDAGNVIKASSHLTIGFLPQIITISNPDITVRNYIEEGLLTFLEQQMNISLENSDLAQWEKLHEQYQLLGGYKRTPLEKILDGLKLTQSLLDRPMKELSSGQKARVALAKSLMENPDILLLDEPTNHLDVEILQWLKTTLHERKGATILVSHDRKFINATCNRLIEINQGKLTSYGGNYDFYLAERKKRIEREIKAYEQQEEEKKLLKQKIKEISFSKAKHPLPSDQDIMAYDYRGGNHQKSVKHHLDSLKERLKEIEKNPLHHPKPKTIKGLRFSETFLASSVAIELEHVKKEFGNKILFSDFNGTLYKKDRVVITGPNGSGKTTLLKCLAGLLPIDSGKIRIAPSAKIAYLDQEIELLPMNQSPLEYFENRFQLSEEALRSELHKAAIGRAELLRRPFFTLSLGQRKRFMLLSLLLEKPNILLLDEPTNHLDLLILEALEEALLHFDGAILAVSHDTTFIEKIATKTWSITSHTV